MKLAIPDLISPSYFPAIAAVELGFFKKEGIDAIRLEEAERDRRDRREIRRRDQVRDSDFDLIPAAWTASFHVAWSSLIA